MKSLKRIAIVAKENNERVSDLFEIKDTYAAFCLDEVCLYLYNMRGERTYIEKIVEQNRGFMKISDIASKVKN